MALQSKELIFNQKPDRSVGFLVRGETCFFYIYTTIPIPNPNDTGKTGDIII